MSLNTVADFAISAELRIAFGIVTGAALVIGALLAFVLPERRYRAWSYQVTEDDLHVQNGIWLKTLTIVPFGRVQHIDIVRGPLQRRYGLGSLVLHTAGTRSAAILLPGLEIAEAERIRDHVRARIREDLV